MIYTLVDKNDAILHEQMPVFDFKNTDIDPLDLACNLAETMLHHNGIGLAANQCGLRYRVFVLYAEEIIPCFNPKIVDVSKEVLYLEEACLSYPGLLVKVKRPKKIKVRYTEPNGITSTRVFDGITARAVQHELNHLDGISHIDLANKYHRDQAYKKWHKFQQS